MAEDVIDLLVEDLCETVHLIGKHWEHCIDTLIDHIEDVVVGFDLGHIEGEALLHLQNREWLCGG